MGKACKGTQGTGNRRIFQSNSTERHFHLGSRRLGCIERNPALGSRWRFSKRGQCGPGGRQGLGGRMRLGTGEAWNNRF
jgi:hypothetical protein